MACVETDIAALRVLFRARFPEFPISVIDDATLDLFIEEALTVFAQSTNGILYLTAHFVGLSQDLGINTTDAGQDESCAAALNMIKVGDFTFQFKDITANSKDNIFTSTEYGKKFLVFRNAAQGYTAGGFVTC